MTPRETDASGRRTSAPGRQQKVAVIGAGPSGLAALRELLEQGMLAVAFESSEELGGVYRSHYGALKLTSSSAITSFGCHPNGDEARPIMWNRNEYLRYLESFAERNDLNRRIRFRTTVTRIARDGREHHWSVVWKDHDGAVRREEFDRVAICSGVHTEPRIPDVPGIETFDGRIVHSSTFSSDETLHGERVLVVGLGESGSDVALLAAKTADAVALSSRNGPGYVVPRTFAGRPTDLDTNRCYHSIPRRHSNNPFLRFKVRIENRYLCGSDDREVLAKADEINATRGRSPFQRFGTKNTSFIEAMLHHGALYLPGIREIRGRSVLFQDGSDFTADRIVFCTGYRARYPFLAECPELAAGGADARGLFKRMFHPDVGDEVAWIGLVRPGFGSIPPMAEMQARFFALVAAGQRKLPSKDAMQTDIESHARLDEEQYPDDAQAIRPLTDYLRFMDAMAREIGCAPRMMDLAIRHPSLWFKTMFAPISGSQFRLYGPGAATEARDALLATPTMPLPVLAYEFAFLIVAKAFGRARRKAKMMPPTFTRSMGGMASPQADPLG